MSYALVEHFVSINGEGPHAGALALFLRFPGCNLQCSYCDTTWANEANCPTESYSLDEIVDAVRTAQVAHVTITGGEPLLQPNMDDLLAALVTLPDRAIEIETNGSVLLTPFLQRTPSVSFTMDYKLPASGMEAFMQAENLGLLRERDSLKFVCGSLADLNRAAQLIREQDLTRRTKVFLSPVYGALHPATMVDFMKENALRGLRLQLQMHKFIWPPEQRGV